jgi:hypothetical protein
MTRLGMMLGHLVTLHLLRAEWLPALQLTTTMYYTAGRQRLGLMYAVWKAAGIAKVGMDLALLQWAICYRAAVSFSSFNTFVTCAVF